MLANQILCALILVSVVASLQAGEPPARQDVPKVMVEAPRPYQVIQRDPGTVSRRAGKTQAGSAQVSLRWKGAEPLTSCDWRVVALPAAFGKTTTWAATAVANQAGISTANVTIPAGGWYRLELRTTGATTPLATVEPIGVGEVFLVAGQSYAANCNDARLQVAEPQQRVACRDPSTGAWRVAHDPQPGASDYRSGGSIWPACGDDLVETLQVPVGFANVALDSTKSEQWLPGQQLHKNLVAAGKGLERFRAVLWQQGESDVMARTTTDTYVANLLSIRGAAMSAWGMEVAWLAAKSTIHPTVYNNPKQEGVIRSAIDRLWGTAGFLPGPDTDTLTGENRGDANSHQHFTPLGQRRAAAMWAKTLAALAERPKP